MRGGRSRALWLISALVLLGLMPRATALAWMAEGDQADAELGHSVASAGDVNGDGFDDVIVGVPGYDGAAGEGVGRALLYLGAAGGLSNSPAWMAEGGRYDARFGASVASAGDVNGDGLGDVLVGAPQEVNDGSPRSRVHV